LKTDVYCNPYLAFICLELEDDLYYLLKLLPTQSSMIYAMRLPRLPA